MNEREAKNFIVNNLHGWKTFNSTELGLLNNDDRLVRALTDIREHEFYAIAKYLKEYADPKNSAKSATVALPKVDDQEIPGTWRHLSCYMVRTDANGRDNPQGKHFNLVQELRRGFLTTLDHSEARLITDAMTPGDGAVNVGGEKRFTLEWKAVDPDLVDALVEGKITIANQASLTYRRAIVGTGETATVAIDGTGFTYKMLNIGTDLSEEGTGVVRVMYGDTDFVLSGVGNYLGSRQFAVTYYYSVPEALAQGILTAAINQGVDATPTGHDPQLGLVNIRVTTLDLTGVSLNDVVIRENCDSKTTASFLWGTGNEALLPIPATIDIPVGTTYDRTLNENGDGTYSIVLRKDVRKYRDLTEYDSAENASSETLRKEWLGVTDEASIASALLTNVTDKVVRIQKNFRDDCSIDITRDIIGAKSLDTDWVTYDSPYGTAGVRVWLNATDANLTTVKGELTTQANAGKTTSLNPRKNEFGLWDITASYSPRNTSSSATSWGAQADEDVTYGRYKDHNGTVWLAMKVYYYYNTTDGAAFTDLKKTTSGYVNVPSYRGVSSGARRVGVGRWVTVRVAVEIVTTTPVTV